LNITPLPITTKLALTPTDHLLPIDEIHL
jgi:hypothetical protein